MRRLIPAWLAAASLSVACATTPKVTPPWADGFARIYESHGKVSDVSALLGALPERCELVEVLGPKIGIGVDPRAPGPPVITVVSPGGAAAAAGIGVGEVVVRVAGQEVADRAQLVRVLEVNVVEGAPLRVETNRGVYALVPIRHRITDCQWVVPSGNASANPGRFVLICRDSDGWLERCAYWFEPG